MAWTAVKAHWTEVGGMQPGSLTTSSDDVFQEGLRFNYLKLFDAGVINQALASVIRYNVRLPESTLGDMQASIAACKVGAERICELGRKYGAEKLLESMTALLDYGEEMARDGLRRLRPGLYTAQTVLEEDGKGGGPFHVKVAITVSETDMVMDFDGTSPQAQGPINLGYPGLLTAARCMFKVVTNGDVPINGGAFRPLQVLCPPSTILSAVEPAPVSFYFDAMQAAMDVIAMALSPIAEKKLSVGHQRSVNGTIISGRRQGSGDLFIMAQPLAGGWGATRDQDGQNGLFSSGSGETYNIPVEIVESRYDLRVRQYGYHDEDGGAGKHRGGKGIVTDFEIMAPTATMTYMATQTSLRPWSRDGGCEGSLNRAELRRSDGSVEVYTVAAGVVGQKGDVFRIVTGTGGGYGDPKERSLAAVSDDLRNGYVTLDQARRHYPQAFQD
ncbi:hydantoinase B/oxoprolinase family protein [Sphingobium indicum]|uniref:hydantoinase B/oxoprolinase family protein n=1 Tax=Sphingobium indicum TaxID=332055 RepID=UPI0009D6B792